MLKFDIITIFPDIFDSYFKESLLDRAQKKKLIKIKVHNLRKWAKDRHRTIDDRPYGGGIGMVLKVEPIYRAVKEIKKKSKVKNRELKVVLFTPRGKLFDQKIAHQLSKFKNIILISGRYEGIDERVAKHVADIELSIGDYVLMGGEIPSMVVIETIARLIPGVLGKPKLLKERVTKGKGFIEYPQYTRPEVFDPTKTFQRKTSAGKLKKSVKGRVRLPKSRKAKVWRVPKVLLSGNHKEIDNWRKKRTKIIKK